MKGFRKIIMLMISLMVSVSLVGCSSGSDTEEKKDTYTVGIVQLVEHNALDDAT